MQNLTLGDEQRYYTVSAKITQGEHKFARIAGNQKPRLSRRETGVPFPSPKQPETFRISGLWQEYGRTRGLQVMSDSSNLDGV